MEEPLAERIQRPALRTGLPVLLLSGFLCGLRPGAARAQEGGVWRFHPAMHTMHGLPFTEPDRPAVGVALSGGGSRGMVHIGTLQALEESGLRPAFITGTSSGAIIGGLYASGYTPQELAALVGRVDWRDLFTDSPERIDLFLGQKEERTSYMLQVRLDGLTPVLPTSYITGQRVRALLTDLTFKGDYRASGDFRNLRIPFTAVCTDLLTSQKVVLSDGSLADAMMASSAVPVLLAAVRSEGRLLVDGGLIDAIPVDVVRRMGAQLIVASDVSAALRPPDKLNNPLEMLDQVMSITMKGPNARSLADADLVISPDLPRHLSTDFQGLDSLVAVGYRTAKAAIAQWEGRPEAAHLIRLAGVHPEHGPPLQVSDVTVSGGDAAQRERARDMLQRELSGRSVDPVGLQEAARRILDDGSLADAVLTARTERGAAGSTVTRVRLEVEIMSRPALREIRFEGNDLYEVPELRKAVRSSPGGPVDARQVASDVHALERYYSDRGYPLAMVRSVAFDEASGVLTFRLDEGRLQDIVIKGTVLTRDVVILREIPYRPGQVFGEENIRQVIDNIYSTGLFEQVSITPRRSPEGGLRLEVEVTERPSTIARLGLHYLEEQRTEGFLEFQNDNLLGLGGKLRIQGLAGPRRNLVEAGTRLDRLFRTYLTYRVRGGWYREDVNVFNGESRTGSYEDESWRFTASVGQQVRRLGQLSIGLAAEDVRVATIEGAALADTRHKFRGFELRSIVDTQDRIPFATEGVRHEFAYESATDVLDRNVSWVRMALSLETFTTFGRHTLHPHLLFETADRTLPPARWFRVGGLDSFYGYSRDQVRGRQVLLMSGEYRYLIPWAPVSPLVVSLRADWGGAWDDALSMALGDMILGGGIKISMDSPLGPLDLAYGRREGGFERYYLALGFRF